MVMSNVGDEKINKRQCHTLVISSEGIKRGKVKVILGQFITLRFIFMGIEHVLKVKRGAGVWDEMQQGRPNGVI